jgi:hypothetical protein
MATYTVALREREEVAERTLGFALDKPSNFTFKAGQFLDIILLNPSETDAEGNRRCGRPAAEAETLVLCGRGRPIRKDYSASA